MNAEYFQNLLNHGKQMRLLTINDLGYYTVTQTRLPADLVNELATLIYRLTDAAQGTNWVVTDRYGNPMFHL